MEKTFVGATVDYFKRKEGQTTGEFQQELRALDDADRKYFTKLLEGVGYKITTPTV